MSQFRNADAPRTMFRIVREDDGGPWWYAGRSGWTRDRQRARVYLTRLYAERLAQQNWSGGKRPQVEAV